MTFLEVFSRVCPRKIRVVLFLSLPTLSFIATWFSGEVPITITIDPSVVLVGEQVTLSCQLTSRIPSNTSVLWYKEEKGRDAPLCSSSSLDGEVEQCQHEERCRIKGLWERRRFLLIIQKVQIADRGVYICVVSGNAVSQEAVTHLDVIAIGNQPALVKDQQEESLCHYTCNSEGWYPRPQVTWTTYGGGKKNVEIKTNVTWSETDLFVVQSIMTVPCDDVDVKCVIMLIKEKINQTGSLNEMILQKPSTVHTCMYKSQIKGTCANPKAVLDIPQGEHLSSLTKTSILEEKYNIFAIENSVEICGQPPPSGLTTDRESYLHIVQQSENHNWLWILYLFCLIFVLEEHQARGRSRKGAEKGTLKKEMGKLHSKSGILERKNEEPRAKSGIMAKKNEEPRAKSENLEKKNKEPRAKSGIMARKNKEPRAKSDILERKNEELRAKSGILERKNEELRAKSEYLEKKNEEPRAKSDILENKSEELHANSEYLEKKNEELRAKSGILERKNEELHAKSEYLEKKNEELRAKSENLEKKNEELRAKSENLEKKNEELRAKSGILEKMNEELRAKSENLEKKNELLRVQRHKVDVTLDADTAHPRLQVSEDGKSVTDTGVIRKVPNKDERFDSHTFLLAKEGYMSGRHYWEVDVGKKQNWNLGVAQETVTRKETVALSPKNGFWVIGLADGQEYWALSDPWTRLMVSGRPQKIGIFLDISSKKLSFFSVHQKKLLYTFTSVNHQSRNVKLFPFFSTGNIHDAYVQKLATVLAWESFLMS